MPDGRPISSADARIHPLVKTRGILLQLAKKTQSNDARSNDACAKPVPESKVSPGMATTPPIQVLMARHPASARQNYHVGSGTSEEVGSRSVGRSVPGTRAPSQTDLSLSSGFSPNSGPNSGPNSNFSTSPRKAPHSRWIAVDVKRAVYHRDQGCCQFVDPQTGRKCRSEFALQYEHRIPFALGGPSTEDNLELLCSAHNQLRAIQSFGAKTTRHLKTL